MIQTVEPNKNKSIFETIVFASGEPIEIEKIAQTMNITTDEVEKIGQLLSEEYIKQNRGFKLIKLDNKFQMCSSPEYFEYVKEIMEIRRNSPLSQAAFEVLAVIAYNQPVTKSVVEQVRGVDCTGVISSLSEKGLIEEKGRLDLPGRPLVYGTTDNFLRSFSLDSLAKLPPIPQDEQELSQTEQNTAE